jgi:hypothetical protein
MSRNCDAQNSARLFWTALAGDQIGGCKYHLFGGSYPGICVAIMHVLDNGDGFGCTVGHAAVPMCKLYTGKPSVGITNGLQYYMPPLGNGEFEWRRRTKHAAANGVPAAG